MAETGGPPGLVAVIAGTGDLPRRIAEARRDAGLPYLLVIFPDCWEDWMAEHPHQLHRFEKVGSLFRALRRADARHVVFAGAMNRPRIRPWAMDAKALTVAFRVLAMLRRGDDAMLRGLASIFEGEGLTMLGPTDILGGKVTVPAGPMGRHAPGKADLEDAARGRAIVNAVGALDVGQGAIVANGLCLGVEAIEGTDLMLARVAELPADRRRTAPPPCGVLYKGPKPGQDMRLDMPIIGPATLEGAAKAGLAGIVVAADRTLVAEPEALRRRADELGLFVYGAREDEL